MSNTTMISTASIALNFISLIGTILIGLMSAFMLTLLAFALVAVPTNIDTVQGDYNFYIAKETLGCRIKAYMFYSFIAIIFNTFTLQAAFRFVRVVYPSHIWLQYGVTYAVIIPVLWIISFLFLLPVHFWHDLQLIPTENICLLTIDGVRGFIWCTLVIYGLPVIMTCIIYIQLLRFIRRSSTPTSIRAKRDVIVVSRIVIIVVILILIDAPSIVLKLILPCTGIGKSLFYRISNTTIVIAMTALSIMLVYVTPQVTEVLVCIGKASKVTGIHTRQQCMLATTKIKH
ncbi:unnamed protein product [Rotaria sordida]|uniref:G-protein coupled receptors family 1 profile domain-containing protein n=1 Tax=Rotaria sordida TaxID=392033 RepID=A0A814CWZ6_9BILA|nr:unnamed protein product [Rotaria sordida]